MLSLLNTTLQHGKTLTRLVIQHHCKLHAVKSEDAVSEDHLSTILSKAVQVGAAQATAATSRMLRVVTVAAVPGQNVHHPGLQQHLVPHWESAPEQDLQLRLPSWQQWPA